MASPEVITVSWVSIEYNVCITFTRIILLLIILGRACIKAAKLSENWEPERIAILDMLLMRMGVCEFLYFETIPPKVTINEYIDLAKDYSTQQSGQFINGILDNIHKDLVRDDKMHKVSFKQP